MKEGRPTHAALYLAPCVAACLAAVPAECGSSESGEPVGPDTTTVVPPQTLYGDVTGTHLPTGLLNGLSMDAGVADLDADGDLDIVIANEFRPNILLLNDGTGRFNDGSSRLPAASRDSEDVGIADFDGDGDLDIVVVSEDDRVNEFYLNDGAGRFSDEGARLPVEGTTNGVVVADVNGDGFPDILFANNGQDAVVINDGTGNFVDETAERLPGSADVTQDLELGDVDGDGDLDLVVANEGPNALYINDGTGRFSDESSARIPRREGGEETREADFGDVDGDGDLDLLFANVAAFVAGADPRNRLLINDGSGFFTDETSTRLPSATVSSFDGDLVDVDGDGDLDIVTANADVDLGVGRIADSRYRAYLNNGGGVFTDASDEVFGSGAVGTGLDLEFADFDGDGRPDLYLASRGTADRLLLRR
ncbi:MAG: VCBS repeat-containing protein [Gemmatimonadetes bacterium]|nr:VCBS repeat-containing protein [Gemmatimonadota bacterium]MYJ17340.1 VCBS repeat-containing protein [Gemmatimonadota bacterium]